jgi:hypothetical protein
MESRGTMDEVSFASLSSEEMRFPSSSCHHIAPIVIGVSFSRLLLDLLAIANVT